MAAETGSTPLRDLPKSNPMKKPKAERNRDHYALLNSLSEVLTGEVRRRIQRVLV
jgi:hypothetical protein